MTILPGTTRTSLSGTRFATPAKGAGILLRGSTSGSTGIIVPATAWTGNLTLPAAAPGGAGYLLSAAVDGTLSWVVPPSGGTPAGVGTEIQYRNGSVFGAVAGSSWDATTLSLPQLSVATTVYIGNGLLSASPTAGYLKGTASSGTNIAGTTLYIDVPVGTGNATPGSIVLRSTVAGASGSSSQALSNMIEVVNGKIGFGLVGRAYAGIHDLTITPGASSSITTGNIGSVLTISTGFANLFTTDMILTPGAYASGASAVLQVGSGNYNGTYLTHICLKGLYGLGIGTSSPTAHLHVRDAVSGLAPFKLTSGPLTASPQAGAVEYLSGWFYMRSDGLSIAGIQPATDDTYYLGKNDDDTPAAWKGVILKDTLNGKYYRIEVTSGVVVATDLTD